MEDGCLFESFEDEPQVSVLVEGVEMGVDVEDEVLDADVAFGVQVQLTLEEVLEL